MKKLLVGTLVAASILGTAAIAQAGYYYPAYIPTCGWVPVWGGWAWVCG